MVQAGNFRHGQRGLCLAPFTRWIPAASSGLSRPESAASCAKRQTKLTKAWSSAAHSCGEYPTFQKPSTSSWHHIERALRVCQRQRLEGSDLKAREHPTEFEMDRGSWSRHELSFP